MSTESHRFSTVTYVIERGANFKYKSWLSRQPCNLNSGSPLSLIVFVCQMNGSPCGSPWCLWLFTIIAQLAWIKYDILAYIKSWHADFHDDSVDDSNDYANDDADDDDGADDVEAD